LVETQGQTERVRTSASRRAGRLLACCLVDGGVRASPLVQESGRSVLDLDVGPDHRLLDVWMDALSVLSWDGANPLLRILHGGSSPAPTPRPAGPLSLEIRADSDSYRGPAGVVRDGMWDQPEDSDFLVCEAARYITTGLNDLVRRHQCEGADVTIAREASGAPAGVLVVARRVLEAVAPKGFVDLKEQWLGRLLTGGARVLVHDLPAGAAMSVRTRLELLRVAAVEAGAAAEFGEAGDCSAPTRLARRLTAGWSVSPRADVGRRAVVARSIVMERAVIGDDAVISSSVVLPGAVVLPGSLVVDRVVG